MRMLRDIYTGELYDADKWYRGANGVWIDREVEKKHFEAIAKADEERRNKRNANRMARGKKRKSPAAFRRSAERYARFLNADYGGTFRDWLKYEKEAYL